MRTKLDFVEPEPQTTKKNDIINRREAEYKKKIKQQREGRKMRDNLSLGDYVLVKRPKEKQVEQSLQTCILCCVQHPGLARRVTNGPTVYRDASQFKPEMQ